VLLVVQSRSKTLTVFGYTLRRLRGQILGWGIALGLMAMLVVSIYGVFADQQAQFDQILEAYPPELMAFFGIDTATTSMFSPEGFISVEFFSFIAPIALGIFAVLTGSGLLAGDEEKGTLDLILAHPVSRTSLFMGRLLAFVTATVGILAIVWLGFIVAMSRSSMGIGWGAILLPLLSLLAVLLVFSTLALLLSMVLPSRGMAASVAGLVMVASYFITSLAKINEDLETIARFFPLNYYQSGEAIHGLNWQWLGGLLLVAVIFALLAWWRFWRRDIRVGGEGGWRLPSLSLPFRRSAGAGRKA
jgi:ABC-2 type transport system permease protein